MIVRTNREKIDKEAQALSITERAALYEAILSWHKKNCRILPRIAEKSRPVAGGEP